MKHALVAQISHTNAYTFIQTDRVTVHLLLPNSNITNRTSQWYPTQKFKALYIASRWANEQRWIYADPPKDFQSEVHMSRLAPGVYAGRSQAREIWPETFEHLFQQGLWQRCKRHLGRHATKYFEPQSHKSDVMCM